MCQPFIEKNSALLTNISPISVIGIRRPSGWDRYQWWTWTCGLCGSPWWRHLEGEEQWRIWMDGKDRERLWFCEAWTKIAHILQTAFWIHFLERWYSHFCHIDGLVQERHNSSVLAMELRLSCINPSICHWSLLLSKGPIDNKSASGPVMVWHWKCTKTLP